MGKFKKGQKVYRFTPWDKNRVCSFELFTVKSCGTKQMTLEKESDGQMLKTFVYPNSTFDNYDSCILAETLPTLAEVIAKGEEFSAAFLAREIAQYQQRLTNTDAGAAYLNEMQKELDNILLQVPTAKSRDELVAALLASRRL